MWTGQLCAYKGHFYDERNKKVELVMLPKKFFDIKQKTKMSRSVQKGWAIGILQSTSMEGGYTEKLQDDDQYEERKWIEKFHQPRRRVGGSACG